MKHTTFTYAQCVQASEKVAWKLEHIISTWQRLDFSRPFLPDVLTRTESIGGLDDVERRTANHITSHGYLHVYTLVEEYVASICMYIEHAYAGGLRGYEDRRRALMRCTDEAFKHQRLFQRYCRAFSDGFAHPCQLVDPSQDGLPQDGAALSRGKSRIAMLLFMLHLELNAEKHCVSSTVDYRGIDPLFASLLRHHWMEEAQHASIATLELMQEAAQASPAEVEQAIDEYLEQVDAFARLLDVQAVLDTNSLERATERDFGHDERHEILASRRRAYGEMFLAFGMLHWRFLNACGQLSASAPQRIFDWVGEHCPEMNPRAA